MGLLHTISVVLGSLTIIAATLTALQLLGFSVPINMVGHGHSALYGWAFVVTGLSIGIAMLLHAFRPAEGSLRRLFDVVTIAGLLVMVISSQ
ncbi:hypothetical protein KJ848_01290 [Patescibacteria group bacterium]|nr:hypothetical protein [Patescibacteria group bacterium]MBU2158797.1 hypothetical protein [Patescibacteria group bacterium]